MKNEVIEAKNEIQSRILTIRGVQVMLDRDLAALYGVETGALNRAVKRNNERFPADFMFQLTAEESLKCQNGISKPQGRGGNRHCSYVFTEQGVAMLSGVLHSATAIRINVEIMRAFIKLLKSLSPLLSRIESTERKQLKLEEAQQSNEERFKVIFDAMNAEKILASDSKLLLREPRRIRRIPSLGLRNPRLDTRVWAEALRIFLEATCWKASRATRGHPEGTSDYRRKATCRVASKKTPRRAAAQPESSSMRNIRRSPCARAASFTTGS